MFWGSILFGSFQGTPWNLALFLMLSLICFLHRYRMLFTWPNESCRKIPQLLSANLFSSAAPKPLFLSLFLLLPKYPCIPLEAWVLRTGHKKYITGRGEGTHGAPIRRVLQRFFFIYFWLRWVFVAARGLSLVAASGCQSSMWCAGFSLRWLLLLWSTGSRRTGFSCCGMRTQ